MLAIAAGGDHFELLATTFSLRIALSQEQGARIDLRAIEQSIQSRIGQRHDVGRFGQIEGQTTQFRSGSADLRQRFLVGVIEDRRIEKAALSFAVGDRCWLEVFKDAFRVLGQIIFALFPRTDCLGRRDSADRRSIGRYRG